MSLCQFIEYQSARYPCYTGYSFYDSSTEILNRGFEVTSNNRLPLTLDQFDFKLIEIAPPNKNIKGCAADIIASLG